MEIEVSEDGKTQLALGDALSLKRENSNENLTTGCETSTAQLNTDTEYTPIESSSNASEPTNVIGQHFDISYDVPPNVYVDQCITNNGRYDYASAVNDKKAIGPTVTRCERHDSCCRNELHQHIKEKSELRFVCNECKETEEYSSLIWKDLLHHFKLMHQDLKSLRYTIHVQKQNCESREVSFEHTPLVFCAVCKKMNICRDQLSSHRHTQYPCVLCDSIFYCKRTFETHITSKCGFRKCEECGKILKIRGFATHKRFHCSTSESILKRISRRNFLCNYCSARFENAKHLEEHTSTRHTKEVLYLCHICGEGFSSYGTVQQHIRLHENRNLWQCDLCSKYFTQIGNLKQHINIHVGQRSFQCSICKASFIQKCNLKRHLTVHSDEGVYTCRFCGKSMKENRSLQMHIKQFHTQPTTYQCAKCDATFRWKCNMTAHQKKGACLKKTSN